jgi:mono/diheme cytochrome c family protein
MQNQIDHSRLNQRIKWWLLIVSIITLCLLVASALRENVFAHWRLVRWEYAQILAEKATDERGQAVANQFENRIVQNVLPELGTVDRCATCHPGIDDPRMTDVDKPFRVHPGDYLAHHPQEKFGCTICHRGQGRALAFEEAKAVGYHWDFPLLPTNLTQSACGLCHSVEEVAQAGGEKYALGKSLFEAKGCISCHKLNGRGGSLGPNLDTVGLKVRGQLPMAHVEGDHTLPQWLLEHFENPQLVVANSLMVPPQLSEEEKEALTIYMLSLQGRDLPESYLSPRKHLEFFQQSFPEPLSGEQLFNRYCAVCHDTGEYGRYDSFYKKFIPAVRGVSLVQTASANYFDETIRRGRPGTLMAGWNTETSGLTNDDLTKLVEYLLSATVEAGDELPDAVAQMATDADFKTSGDAARGQAIFLRHCSGCHGPDGAGLLAPALNNPVLQQTATDGFLYATIAAGRRNTAMPAFLRAGQGGLTEQDVSDVVAYVRALDASKVTLANADAQAPDFNDALARRE